MIAETCFHFGSFWVFFFKFSSSSSLKCIGAAEKMEGADKLPTGLCPLVVFCKPARRRVGEMVESVIHWEKTALADVLKLIFDHLLSFCLSFCLSFFLSYLLRGEDQQKMS